jgi:hypothetical protein
MAASGMRAHSADIETAFLNDDLQEEIFMSQPKGAADGTSRVLRLKKTSTASNKLPVSGTPSLAQPSPPVA